MLRLRRACAARRFSGPAVAEQPFEYHPRVVLGGQRRRRRRPCERVEVGAAVAVLALAGEEVQIDGELERRQCRVFAQHRRRDLIGGDTVADVGPFGALGIDASQPQLVPQV